MLFHVSSAFQLSQSPLSSRHWSRLDNPFPGRSWESGEREGKFPGVPTALLGPELSGAQLGEQASGPEQPGARRVLALTRSSAGAGQGGAGPGPGRGRGGGWGGGGDDGPGNARAGATRCGRQAPGQEGADGGEEKENDFKDCRE